MTTLWAFGDSYTVGHELGTDKSFDDVTEWLKNNVGTNSIDSARAIWAGVDYYEKVSGPWYEHINHSMDPNLSYAGLIAKKLGVNYINKAECGVGLDFCFNQMLSYKEHINKNDIVLLGVPPFNRWLGLQGQKYNYKKASSYEMLPNEKTMVTWNIGMLLLLKKHFPSLYVIDLGQNRKYTEEDLYIEYCNETTINDFADEYLFGRYPGLHPTEEIHEEFAEYLLEEII